MERTINLRALVKVFVENLAWKPQNGHVSVTNIGLLPVKTESKYQPHTSKTQKTTEKCESGTE